MSNSFGSKANLNVGDRRYTIHRLDAVLQQYPQAANLPFSLKVLLENLLRTENGQSVSRIGSQADSAFGIGNCFARAASSHQ